MPCSTRARDLLDDGGVYRADPPITGDLSRVAEVRDVEFPCFSHRRDLPHVTIITQVRRTKNASLLVRGTTASNTRIKAVRVNGRPACPLASDLSEWEVVLSGEDAAAEKLVAGAEDSAGLAKATPHELALDRQPAPANPSSEH